MSGAPVELRVAGQTYRVVASAEAEVLHRLAAVVDARVNQLTLPGRQVSPQSVLLAAISLAHDLEEERAKRARVEARACEMFGTLLERVDKALEESQELMGASDAKVGEQVVASSAGNPSRETEQQADDPQG